MNDDVSGHDIDEARRLLTAVVDTPALVSQIGEDELFVDAGVNSGEMIRLLYECERYLDVELDEREVGSVSSLSGLAALLRRYRPGAEHVV